MDLESIRLKNLKRELKKARSSVDHNHTGNGLGEQSDTPAPGPVQQGETHLENLQVEVSDSDATIHAL